MEIGDAQLPLLVEPLEDPVPVAATEDTDLQELEEVSVAAVQAD